MYLDMFPDLKSRVNFIPGDITKIAPSQVNAPASIVYNLFPGGSQAEIVEIGGATARFVDDDGTIHVLTELTGKDLLNTPNRLTNQIADVLNKRGLEILHSEQKTISKLALETGRWDLGVPIISAHPNNNNTLFVFKVGRTK